MLRMEASGEIEERMDGGVMEEGTCRVRLPCPFPEGSFDISDRTPDRQHNIHWMSAHLIQREDNRNKEERLTLKFLFLGILR